MAQPKPITSKFQTAEALQEIMSMSQTVVGLAAAEELQKMPGIIPESTARAGLSFISRPMTLITPMWAESIAGRTAAGITANVGKALSLANEAITNMATLFGLIGESAAFVGASFVIASSPEKDEATPRTGLSFVSSPFTLVDPIWASDK